MARSKFRIGTYPVIIIREKGKTRPIASTADLNGTSYLEGVMNRTWFTELTNRFDPEPYLAVLIHGGYGSNLPSRSIYTPTQAYKDLTVVHGLSQQLRNATKRKIKPFEDMNVDDLAIMLILCSSSLNKDGIVDWSAGTYAILDMTEAQLDRIMPKVSSLTERAFTPIG